MAVELLGSGERSRALVDVLVRLASDGTVLEVASLDHCSSAWLFVSGQRLGAGDSLKAVIALASEPDRAKFSSGLQDLLDRRERSIDFTFEGGQEGGGLFLRVTGTAFQSSATDVVLLFAAVTQVSNTSVVPTLRGHWAQNVIQSSNELVSMVDRSGTVLYSSPAMAQVLGYRPEDRDGQAGFALIHEEDREATVQAFRELLSNSGGVFRIEHRVLHSDGNWRWLEATARNLLDEPAIQAIVVNARDITERKLAQVQQAHFAAVVAASGEAIIGSTLDGRITSWNPSAERLYGYTAGEILGKPLQLLTPPECATELKTIANRVKIGGSVVGFETIRVRKDGSRVAVSLSVSPIFGPNGEATGYSSVARDITASRAAAIAFRESAESFESLFHARTEGIAIHEEGRIVTANRKFCELLGTDPRSVKGQSVFDFVADSSKQKALEYSRIPEGANYEVFARKSDGSEFPVDVMAAPVRYHGRDMRLITVRDVSSRYEAEAAIRVREEKFRSLVQNSTDIITVIGRDGETLYLSPSMERVLGYTEEEFDRCTRADLVHPFDIPKLNHIWDEISRDPSVVRRHEYRVKHAHGHWLWFEAVFSAYLLESGAHGIVTNARDVTERKISESQLRFTTELLDQALAAVVATTNEGHITHWNRYAEELYGWSRDDAIGRQVASLLPDLSPARFDVPVDDSVDERSERETTVVRKDGVRKELLVSTSHVYDEMKKAVGVISVAVDVSERKRLEEQLRHSALHDSLTGLPNRTLLADRLSHALSQSGRRGAKVALLFLDLDRFKLINDGFGHAVGDRVLQEVAGRLTGSLRTGDTLARIGGDEFVVLLEDVRRETVVRDVARRLSSALDQPFVLDGKEMRIGVSIGVSLSSSDSKDSERLMSEADTALYQSKSIGRGAISFHNAGMQNNAERRLTLEVDLQKAIRRKELELHYQPIIDLTSGRVKEIEALVRWRHPRYGMLPPGEFIPLAEETGMIIAMGRWVAMEACRSAVGWSSIDGEAIEPAVAINVSASQFRDPKLSSVLARELKQSGLDPSRLCIEITEHLLVEDVESTARTLGELRDLGIRISIDDFGTGYSSLGYLRHLPVDVIKLDRAFVRGLGADAGSLAIVEGITSLAHSLGLSVTAEGIETEEQLAYVRSAGCDHGQGYLLARPAPNTEVSNWLGVDLIVGMALSELRRKRTVDRPEIALRAS